MAVKWTKTTLANLVTIVEYIEKDIAERAKSFALEIKAKTNSLAGFSGMGRPGRVIGTRELVMRPNYIIPYRVRGDVVEVLLALRIATGTSTIEEVEALAWPGQFQMQVTTIN